MLDHVKRIEENPQRMRRICQAAVSEGVRGEQVAELVVNLRLRHRHPGQQRQTREDRGAADRDQRRFFVLRKPRKPLLDARENHFGDPRLRQNQSGTDRENDPVYFLHGGFTDFEWEITRSDGIKGILADFARAGPEVLRRGNSGPQKTVIPNEVRNPSFVGPPNPEGFLTSFGMTAFGIVSEDRALRLGFDSAAAAIGL